MKQRPADVRALFLWYAVFTGRKPAQSRGEETGNAGKQG